MIAIRDIIIFLSGVALVTVYNLTRNYLYGKRISVSGITRVEEPHKTRKISTGLPEVDKDRFSKIIAEINTIDEFSHKNERLANRRDMK